MTFPGITRHTEHDLHDPPRARAQPVHGERPASPSRAARPLLPDAGLVRGVRGPRPGDVPARRRMRHTYAGRSSLRAWLYKIATNACLDALDKRPRRVSATGEVSWLQPYPDELLEELPGEEDDPEVAAVEKETIELAYLVAIQRLAPLQRAVLILRDVLDCSARETADVLETSAPAVNSALQRARAAMKEHLPERRSEWPANVDATSAERDLLARYVEASERA